MTKIKYSSEYWRLVEKLKRLNEEKRAYRSKAILNWKERQRLQLLFEKVKQERDTANAILTEAKQTLQEFQEELQRKNRSKEEAWKKASESSAELEALKLQFNTLKSRFLQKQPDPQTDSDASPKHDQAHENTKLRKALDATLRKVDNKDLSIRKLKNHKKALLKEKKHLKIKIYQQAKLHQIREAKHKINLASKVKIIDSLKSENRNLRKLQQKTIRKLNTDNCSVVKQPPKITKKTKPNKTEGQKKYTNRLERKKPIQEPAIATSNDGLNTLNKENTALTQEKDRLISELRKLKDQHFHAEDIQQTPLKNTGLSLQMLQL